MPIASGTLAALLVPAIGGAAKAGIGALSADKDRSHEEKMKKMNITKPGFNNFGDDLVDEQGQDRFNLGSSGRPVIFPGMRKTGRF